MTSDHPLPLSQHGYGQVERMASEENYTYNAFILC